MVHAMKCNMSSTNPNDTRMNKSMSNIMPISISSTVVSMSPSMSPSMSVSPVMSHKAVMSVVSKSPVMSKVQVPSLSVSVGVCSSGVKRGYDKLEASNELPIAFIKSAFARTSNEPLSEDDARRFMIALRTLAALYQMMPSRSIQVSGQSHGLIEAASQRFGLISISPRNVYNVKNHLYGSNVSRRFDGSSVNNQSYDSRVNSESYDSSVNQWWLDSSEGKYYDVNSSFSRSDMCSDMSMCGQSSVSVMSDMSVLNRVGASVSSGRVVDTCLIDAELESNVVGYAWENGATIKHALVCRC